MSLALAHTDSNIADSDGVLANFVCSWTDGGPDAAWVHLAGELDIATAPQLERTLRDPALQARLVVVDLRELGFIDSFGVHVIVEASVRARRDGRRLLLLRGRPCVDRLFALTPSANQVEIGDVAWSEPAVEALMQLAGGEPLS
jgi:anti-anti-sigma factor